MKVVKQNKILWSNLFKLESKLEKRKVKLLKCCKINKLKSSKVSNYKSV